MTDVSTTCAETVFRVKSLDSEDGFNHSLNVFLTSMWLTLTIIINDAINDVFGLYHEREKKKPHH